jgi:hypothetical protein
MAVLYNQDETEVEKQTSEPRITPRDSEHLGSAVNIGIYGLNHTRWPLGSRVSSSSKRL